MESGAPHTGQCPWGVAAAGAGQVQLAAPGVPLGILQHAKPGLQCGMPCSVGVMTRWSS